MYPHERSLVKRFEGKPFVLLGVNSDEERAAAQQVATGEGMTWRSWWDGPGGPIVTRWGVTCWPTFFVLDARGVVRYRLDNVHEVERAVESLLRELG